MLLALPETAFFPRRKTTFEGRVQLRRCSPVTYGGEVMAPSFWLLSDETVMAPAQHTHTDQKQASFRRPPECDIRRHILNHPKIKKKLDK